MDLKKLTKIYDKLFIKYDKTRKIIFVLNDENNYLLFDNDAHKYEVNEIKKDCNIL